MKVKNLSLFIFVFSLLFAAVSSTAQTPTRNINNEVVNGKAISLPKPVYPPAAQAVRASGAVNVQVTIDEQGNVIIANAVSGHPLLRSESEQAAKEAKFSPTLTKTTGVIVYNFTPKNTSNISARVLNDQAITLAKPKYPTEARRAKIEGIVNVQVTINEYGKVETAKAISGPQELRKVSEQAALSSTFRSTTGIGQGVKVTGSILYYFLSSQVDTHQTPKVEEAVTTDGFKAEVLNKKAVNLPLPEYPPAARAVKAGGKVNIQVFVDEKGNVVNAKAVSGHPLLTNSALEAAKQAKFSPTFINGKSVKVTGVLIFNFDQSSANQ